MRLGEKIQHLRLRYGLTQQELADRAELSKSFISQLERDLTSPSIETLTDILECLGTNLGEFFSEREEEKIVFDEGDMFVKEDETGSIVWLVPNAQKNALEPILLVLHPGQSSAKHDPHEGEDFGYVLQGMGVLVMGERSFKIKKGSSFYFRSSKLHYIENRGKSDLKILWAATPPSF